jgi:AraC-like DNA-binding protein
MVPVAFACTPHGLERRSRGEFIARHRHRHPYASIVLSGGYEEAGDRGRRFVGAGDVVLHHPFEAHLDRFTSKNGAEIFGLELPEAFEHPAPFVKVPDPDLIVRAATRHLDAALATLLAMAVAHLDQATDWPDLLAEALTRDPNLSLQRWAAGHALAPATVSRGFRQVYGVSPNAFRAQARARLAWRLALQGRSTLSAIAAQTGFADQSHMTRGVYAITERTPGAWHGKVK